MYHVLWRGLLPENEKKVKKKKTVISHMVTIT